MVNSEDLGHIEHSVLALIGILGDKKYLQDKIRSEKTKDYFPLHFLSEKNSSEREKSRPGNWGAPEVPRINLIWSSGEDHYSK